MIPITQSFVEVYRKLNWTLRVLWSERPVPTRRVKTEKTFSVTAPTKKSLQSHDCSLVHTKGVALTSSAWLAMTETVFLIRSAVSRAAPFCRQHSFIRLAIWESMSLDDHRFGINGRWFLSQTTWRISSMEGSEGTWANGEIKSWIPLTRATSQTTSVLRFACMSLLRLARTMLNLHYKSRYINWPYHNKGADTRRRYPRRWYAKRFPTESNPWHKCRLAWTTQNDEYWSCRPKPRAPCICRSKTHAIITESTSFYTNNSRVITRQSRSRPNFPTTSAIIHQYLPFRPHSIVWGDIDCVRSWVVSDSEAEIGDATSTVPLYQNVFGLEVTMRDSRLALDRRKIERKMFLNRSVKTTAVAVESWGANVLECRRFPCANGRGPMR